MRPKQTSADLLRFVLSVKLRKPRRKLRLKVSIYAPSPTLASGADLVFDSVL